MEENSTSGEIREGENTKIMGEGESSGEGKDDGDAKSKDEGGGECEEDEDDDIDFNPFLEQSPSLEATSGLNSEEEEPEEGGQENSTDNVFKEEEITDDFYMEDAFLELGSEHEHEEEAEEEEEDDDDDDDDNDHEEGEENDEDDECDGDNVVEVNEEVQDVSSEKELSAEEDAIIEKEADKERAADATDEARMYNEQGQDYSDMKIMTQVLVDELIEHASTALPELKFCGHEAEFIEKQVIELADEDDDILDTISRRTRAHYSLADMSLDQLETFLQESDEEDYFQNVDDEEEYRKFLAAVTEEKDIKESTVALDEDEDEDDDADFEIEIEEALQSDNDDGAEQESEAKKRLQQSGRRPQTREQRRERVMLQSRERLLGFAKAPLRPLVPYNGSMHADSSKVDRKSMIMEGTWANDRMPPTIGFSAHQIGQLYCQIHEHLQLLVQVFCLCVLEPSRQQVAIDTHKMLMELVDKRNCLLSWKQSGFPDYCFRLPYIHPSISESTDKRAAGSSSNGTSLDNANAVHLDSSHADSIESEEIMWIPKVSGPVYTLLDVGPLALVKDFLADIATVVQNYRQRHVESGTYHSQCEREPLFKVSAGVKNVEGTRSGKGTTLLSQSSKSTKKTMAAILVENTKKESIALVPSDVARAISRFSTFFNHALFPHKPPPPATANRLLFTDAEDELLALGLMVCNTDWRAIQQRFLPSKTVHQIFVRQKNRTSARAPENSIKAVRRMKQSALTEEEKTSIQEALRCFKHDWAKVWQHAVPHRDPALLPRQWKIALGAQKSYKSDELAKERRKLNEAHKRQARRSQKIGSEVKVQQGTTNGNVESDHMCEGNSGDEEGEDLDFSYIHEAFLSDWKPGTTRTDAVTIGSENFGRAVINCREEVSEMHHESSPAKVPRFDSSGRPEIPISRSKSMKSIPMTSAYHPTRVPPTHTVKLAPGLPLLNLPPHVRVMTQNTSSTSGSSLAAASVSKSSQPVEHLYTTGAPGLKTSSMHLQMRIPNAACDHNNLERQTGSYLDHQAEDGELQLHPLLLQSSTRLASLVQETAAQLEINCATDNLDVSQSQSEKVEHNLITDETDPRCQQEPQFHRFFPGKCPSAHILQTEGTPDAEQFEKDGTALQSVTTHNSFSAGADLSIIDQNYGSLNKACSREMNVIDTIYYKNNHRNRNDDATSTGGMVSLDKNFTCEGAPKCTSSHQFEGIAKVPKSPVRRKRGKGRVERGGELDGENFHSDIIMEKEELSDSGEEESIGVNFEYEEMGDSDNELNESEGKQNEGVIHFEEEEILSDDSGGIIETRCNQNGEVPGKDFSLYKHGDSAGASSYSQVKHSPQSCQSVYPLSPTSIDCQRSKSYSNVQLITSKKNNITKGRRQARQQRTSHSSAQESASGFESNASLVQEEQDEHAIKAAEVLAVIHQNPSESAS